MAGQFPPHHRLSVIKTLMAWSLRIASPAYEPVPPTRFLLAVPSGRGCQARAFNALSLQGEPPATLDAMAQALSRLSQGGLMPDVALCTLARMFVATLGARAWLAGAIPLAQPFCVFTNEARVGRGKAFGVVALPTTARRPLQNMLTSGAWVPHYARTIFDGVAEP